MIVTNSINEDVVPYVEKALGLITEENGITSPSAIVGLEKGIPTVVGVEKAVKNISNNMLVTIDAAQGKIFARICKRTIIYKKTSFHLSTMERRG
ncbi:PEP-utilizing enzyme [Staphylococcus aureus]